MKKYLINLDKRTDKLQEVTKHLTEEGITNWERFSAFDMAQSRTGCKMSHLEVLKMAPKKGTFVVFEDDVMFLDGWKGVLRKAFRQLPDDWDCLYLGATLTKDLIRYSENLFRLKGGWTSHVIVWNNRNGVIDYILNNSEDYQKVDVFFADVIQEKFNCYITYPLIATQRAGFSDILKRETQYEVIQNWYSKHTQS